MTCHLPFKKTDLTHFMTALPSPFKNRYYLLGEQGGHAGVERRADGSVVLVGGILCDRIGARRAIVAFAAIRERLRYSDMPKGMHGLASAFLVTGLMSLGFAAFSRVPL